MDPLEDKLIYEVRSSMSIHYSVVLRHAVPTGLAGFVTRAYEFEPVRARRRYNIVKY